MDVIVDVRGMNVNMRVGDDRADYAISATALSYVSSPEDGFAVANLRSNLLYSS
jgi:hypothetical protein